MKTVVTYCWLSIYRDSRNIQSLPAILHSQIFPDLRNNVKRIGTSLSEFSMSYGILQASLALRMPTTPT